MTKLGATGDFPQGKLNEHDEGGINIKIAREGESIIIDFGTETTWIGMPRDEAINFARMILKYAGVTRLEIEI